MFNFFSRKPAQPALTKESPETQIVPETQETDSIAARNQQLRTPSPSATSVISRGNNVNLSPLLGKQQTPSGPPITPSPPPDPLLDKPNRDAELGLISDPAALHALVSSIPPKILHEYTLKHLIPPARSTTNIHPPSSLTLTHLTSFFSSLTPPPKLHCVRCHKFFYEVENDDRSCLVPHDDDSAEVERVGSSKKVDTAYQTLWGCCGKMVEGDGDMGPPDGWCYEGKHTTDTKRARFRADSTIHNDKLNSCDKLKCFEPPASSPESESDIGASPRPRKRKRTSRKRTAAQSTAGEEQGGGPTAVVGEGYEDDDEEEDDAMSVVSTRSKSSSRPKKKPKSLAATTSAAVAAGIPLPSSPGPSTPITAQATTTTSSSAPGSSSAAAPRPRKKRAKTTHDDKSFRPEATPVDDDDEERDNEHMMDVDGEGLTLTASSGKKRPGRPKGSKNKKSAVVVTTTTMMTGASVSVPTSPAAVGSGGGGGGGGGSKKKSVSPTREGGGGGGGNGSGGKKTHRPSVSFSATTKKDKDVVVGTSTSASASASSGSQRISGSMRPKKKTVKKLEEVVATSVEGEEGM